MLQKDCKMLAFIIFFSYLCIVERNKVFIDRLDKIIFVKQRQQKCGDLLQGADYYIWGDMREKGTPFGETVKTACISSV